MKVIWFRFQKKNLFIRLLTPIIFIITSVCKLNIVKHVSFNFFSSYVVVSSLYIKKIQKVNYGFEKCQKHPYR